MTAASVGNRAPAVLRRTERRRFSSASDDEVGGPQARDARAAQNRRVTRLSRQCQLENPRLRWALVTFAKSERAELCDLFDKVGPRAPTLCEGWDTHDLAAHLWIRETDPVGASGIVAKPLSSLYERRMTEIKQRWEYPELVDRVRRGPARFSIFAIPGVDEGANTTEFFIHHEDVRRAGDSPQTSRQLGKDVEEWMWRRLKLLGRAWFRRVQVGVVLERLGSADADGAPETIRAVSGASTVTLVGSPSELMLYAHGRTKVAEIKLVGEPEAIEILNSADLRT
jgi:uncharacterized protein (TIGR03085 family)